MIKLQFCKWHDWNNLKVIELHSYKEFFEFFLKNHQEGCIWDVKDDGNTK